MHALKPCLPACAAGAQRCTPALCRSRAQQGQALVEGLLVLLVAGLLWLAIVQIAQLQDMAIQAQHASRVAAFAAAHDTLAADTTAVRQTYFAGAAHRWRDSAGRRMLPDPATQASLRLTQHAPLSARAQPGQTNAQALPLRREWRVEDTGVVRADAAVHAQVPFAAQDSPGITIRRWTAILRDAGHSPDARSAQHRVGESATAWGDAARRSQAVGERVQRMVEPLDAGWNRPSPFYDWLMPWAGEIPGQVLHE